MLKLVCLIDSCWCLTCAPQKIINYCPLFVGKDHLEEIKFWSQLNMDMLHEYFKNLGFKDNGSSKNCLKYKK